MIFKRHQIQRRSKEAEEILNQMKQNATTREEQIEILKLKLRPKD